VLEHIPPDDLVELFSILRPKLKPDGLMLHVVDNSDHMEHRDKSISRLNFLTWPSGRHQLINRWMQGGENRLRHHEYKELFKRAGFKLVHEHSDVHAATEQAVENLRPRLQPQYAAMSSQQLATLTSFFVLAPASSAPQAG
jgi:Methyltransferase domain